MPLPPHPSQWSRRSPSSSLKCSSGRARGERSTSQTSDCKRSTNGPQLPALRPPRIHWEALFPTGHGSWGPRCSWCLKKAETPRQACSWEKRNSFDSSRPPRGFADSSQTAWRPEVRPGAFPPRSLHPRQSYTAAQSVLVPSRFSQHQGFPLIKSLCI